MDMDGPMESWLRGLRIQVRIAFTLSGASILTHLHVKIDAQPAYPVDAESFSALPRNLRDISSDGQEDKPVAFGREGAECKFSHRRSASLCWPRALPEKWCIIVISLIKESENKRTCSYTTNSTKGSLYPKLTPYPPNWTKFLVKTKPTRE